MLFVDIVDEVSLEVLLAMSSCSKQAACGDNIFSHIVACPIYQFTHWSVPTSPEVHVDIVAEVSLKGLPGEVQLYKSERLRQPHI